MFIRKTVTVALSARLPEESRRILPSNASTLSSGRNSVKRRGVRAAANMDLALRQIDRFRNSLGSDETESLWDCNISGCYFRDETDFETEAVRL